MSYILDALRRAEAERERGAVPSLQSHQHAIADDDAERAARPRALVWALVAVTVALLAALAWNLFGRASPSSAQRAGTVEGAATPSPVAPAAPAAPAVLLPTTPSPAVAPTVPASAEATPPPAKAAVPPRAPARAQAESNRPTRHAAEPKERPGSREDAAGARGSGDARIYKLAELPEDVRRDLPRLVIGGASYSGDAASRMVMINGQVFHEGDQLAPNLVLERIKLKSAVLSYKGYRYEVTF